MSKHSKSKRTVEQGAERVVEHMDEKDLVSMSNKENEKRKQKQQENLSLGGD
ncbi:hypothetical protein [Pseudalkalibacillus caeni]|uniref:hypothetical protein n=1 Tax=Exobacillus caeni TaxID=2574798 RepID=UPI001484F678|nr:hypothetical protein [Pseudalkalibacillus caeni]